MLKHLMGGVVIAAALIFVGTGCESAPAEDTQPVPEAVNDPEGGFNGGAGGGFENGGKPGSWQAGGAVDGADPDGWTLADPSGNRLGMPIIYFAYDSDLLVPSETAKLDSISAYLANKPVLALVIEGHCDQRGTDEYNRALGERRANAIREYLVGHGLADNRIKTISYGKDKPAVQGSGESVWSQNRRGVPVPMRMPR